jgi:hypothetical protein
LGVALELGALLDGCKKALGHGVELALGRIVDGVPTVEFAGHFAAHFGGI